MPPQMYGDAYGAPGYNQYGVPPPQAGFPADAYSGMPAQSAGFNAAYPPPGSWGVGKLISIRLCLKNYLRI